MQLYSTTFADVLDFRFDVCRRQKPRRIELVVRLTPVPRYLSIEGSLNGDVGCLVQKLHFI